MKVNAWIETHCDVEVSTADFIGALWELPEEDHVPTAISAISACYSVLKRIPDAIVAQMNDKQKKIIREALRIEAARYD